ncbi:hypothetical protein MGG_16767, partial [Pyricularia oryzae 70-15]
SVAGQVRCPGRQVAYPGKPLEAHMVPPCLGSICITAQPSPYISSYSVYRSARTKRRAVKPRPASSTLDQ